MKTIDWFLKATQHSVSIAAMNFDTLTMKGSLRFFPTNNLLHIPTRIPKKSLHAHKNFEQIKEAMLGYPRRHHFYVNLTDFVVKEQVYHGLCNNVAHAAMQKGHRLSLQLPDEVAMGACHDMKLEHLVLRKYNTAQARIFKVYHMDDTNAERVFFQLQADISAAPTHIGIHLKHDPLGSNQLTVANFAEACHLALDRCYRNKIDVRLLIEIASDEVYDSIKEALMLYGQDMYYKIKLVSSATYTLRESLGFSELHVANVCDKKHIWQSHSPV